MTISKKSWIFVYSVIVLLLVTLLVYGDIFFLGNNLIYSSPNGDLAMGYFNVQFTFNQIHQGIFPLWSPGLMGGYPFFANLQTQIFYPPAWIWYFLPITTGTNIYFILHIFLLGAGTFCWLWFQGRRAVSALVGAMLMMFGAPVSTLIFMGHTTPLATITWVPWILFCIDQSFKTKRYFKLYLTLIVLLALQLTAGFPQLFFYTSLCVFPYFAAHLFNSLESNNEKFKRCFLLLTCYGFSVLLFAIQLTTSLEVMHNTARKAGLPAHYLGLFSMSPYSLITLVSPYFFGDGAGLIYWGPWIFALGVFYFGITAFTFMIIGLFHKNSKRKWLYLGIILFFFIISLGSNTPLFLLTSKIPPFDLFRSSNRAFFYVQLFIIGIASIGLDQLFLKIERRPMIYVYGFLGVLLTSCCSAYYIISNSQNSLFTTFWGKFALSAARPYHDAWINYNHTLFPIITKHTLMSLVLPILSLIVCACLYWVATHRKIGVSLLAVFCTCEVLFFAVHIKRGFPIEMTQNDYLLSYLKKHPGDVRFLKIPLSNWGSVLPQRISAGDINGFESFRLQRYDEFINYCLHRKLDVVPNVLYSVKYHHLYRLLRCKYYFKVHQDNKGKIYYKVIEKPGTLPHLLLLEKWKIVPQKEKVLKSLSASEFDPMKQVVIETMPQFYPSKANLNAQPKVTLLRSSTQWLDIKATTDKKSILLVTDAYAKGWKVFPYPDSSQQNYDVMPADYILRGIPLSPGTHHFRLEYAPDAFYRGRTISLAALAAYLLAWIALLGLTLRKKWGKQSLEEEC